jgi:predicted TPR repeat methyltransferase
MTVINTVGRAHLSNNVAIADEVEEARLRDAINTEPKSVSALISLGRFLTAHSHDREAASLFRRALQLDSTHLDARFFLGELLNSYAQHRDEAIALLRDVLTADSGRTVAYRPLASSLLTQGKREEAIAVLRDWVIRAPGDPTASHLLAAYSHEAVPKRAPDDFVRKTFDESADYFDALLRETLHYCAPEVLLEKLQASAVLKDASVCDFGCGTGLCAPLLRPLAKRLVGVDLSSRMVEKAEALFLYDALTVAEGTFFLRSTERVYDLIFAADTLEYFGALDELLSAAFAALCGDGILAFTVEKQSDNNGSPFELGDTGRYRHGAAYVIDQLSKARFIDIRLSEATVRIEAGRAVAALIVVARKPSDG